MCGLRLVSLDDHTAFLVDRTGCVIGILSSKDLLSERRLLDRIRERACRGDTQNVKKKADVGARLAALSPREREVMDGLIVGKHAKSIARELGISPKTVEFHRANLYKKMRVDNLVALVRMLLLDKESECVQCDA